MLNYSDHFAEIERSLRGLVSEKKITFSASEILEVEEFIEAHEYGLAIETFAAILLDRADDLDGITVATVQNTARAMEIFNSGAVNGLVDRYERQHFRMVM